MESIWECKSKAMDVKEKPPRPSTSSGS